MLARRSKLDTFPVLTNKIKKFCFSQFQRLSEVKLVKDLRFVKLKKYLQDHDFR